MDRADTQLWNGWQGGDEHAFAALVEPHLGFAFDFARRLGCRPDQADDVVQEALTRLAQEQSERPVRVGIRAWLGRSVSLQARMLKRAEGRRLRRERSYEVPESTSVETTRFPRVDRAIEALPPRQREALILRYRHDLEYAEVARILDISVNAARLRVHKAMRELRARLGKNAGPMVAALPLLEGTGRAPILEGALLKSAVLEGSALAGATTSGSVFLLGALAMKQVLVVAAIVAAGITMFVVMGPDDPGAGQDPIGTGIEERAPIEVGSKEPTPELMPQPERAAAPPAPVVPTPDSAVDQAQGPALDAVERLLAQGARVAFVSGSSLDGTRHRVKWYGKEDTLPAGQPTGIDLQRADLQTLLGDEALLRALLYLTAESQAFDDRALETIAAHADLKVLRLTRSGVTDQGMEALGRLPSLTMLELKHTGVGDEGMQYIGRLAELRWLDVRDTHLSDAGMAYLQRLERLEKFEFGGTNVTDAGLEHLGATRLRHLNLEETRITGAGLAHLDLSRLEELEADEAGAINDALLENLSGARVLKELVLKETSITDAGLAHLRGITSLEDLDLNNTAVTDEGLEVLAGLPNLKELSLRQTSVTDAAVAVLVRLSALERLNISDTRITEAGVARLREAFPELRLREP